MQVEESRASQSEGMKMATAGPDWNAWGPQSPAARGVAWIGGALTWAVAGVAAAVLAVVLAATLVAAAVVGSGALGLVALAMRAGRKGRARGTDQNVIEAHHVGGHSWVAYGWHGRP